MNAIDESAEQPATEPRLWTSGKKVIDTLLVTAQRRIELFEVEVQEEKCRLVHVMMFVAAVVAFALMTLSMLTITVVVYFWKDGPFTVLISLSLIYLTATAFAWRGLKLRLQSPPSGGPFTSSIDELKKDRACLQLNSNHNGKH